MRHFWILSTCLSLASSSFAMNCNVLPPCKQKEAQPSEEPNQCQDMCECSRWTGVTVGFNLGALVNASKGHVKPIGDFKLPANVPDNPQRTDSFDMHGAAFVTGAQIGYNYQLKVMVVGLETDFNYCTLDKKHEHSKVLTGALSGNFDDKMSQLFNWFGTFRSRLGYAFKVPVLIYGTGGFAYGHVKSKTSVGFTSTHDQYEGGSSKWRIGWTLGAGLEWGFTRHWSMKGEYLYLQLRDSHYRDPNHPLPAFPTFSYHSELETQAHIIRLGFNYMI